MTQNFTTSPLQPGGSFFTPPPPPPPSSSSPFSVSVVGLYFGPGMYSHFYERINRSEGKHERKF